MLRYIGEGRYWVGIPARDLGDEEIATLLVTELELIATGLYARVENKAVRRYDKGEGSEKDKG